MTSGGLKHGLMASFVPEPTDIVDYAVAAEETGWDGMFQIDHLSDYSVTDPTNVNAINDPWITWAGVATKTTDIRLGSNITPVPRRQPWQLARNLATLDRLSDGRVILGAGLGGPMEYKPFGREYDQPRLAEQYEEALDVITGLWSGEPFSYDGEYFSIDNEAMRPMPIQEPRIPIVIGGWWPFKGPFRRGARWDGIIPNWPSIHCDAPYLDEMPDHMQEVVPDEPDHETEVREMLTWYHEYTDDPGEVMLLGGGFFSPEFIDTCESFGATWILHSPIDPSLDKEENLDRIRKGPSESHTFT